MSFAMASASLSRQSSTKLLQKIDFRHGPCLHIVPFSSAMHPTPTFRKLSILVAAYNEEETLTLCLDAVLAAPLPAGIDREIIVVNDGSLDRTWEVAQQISAEHPEVRIFQQPKNMGKGAALQRAIQ